jgi:hypothetical protein
VVEGTVKAIHNQNLSTCLSHPFSEKNGIARIACNPSTSVIQTEIWEALLRRKYQARRKSLGARSARQLAYVLFLDTNTVRSSWPHYPSSSPRSVSGIGVPPYVTFSSPLGLLARSYAFAPLLFETGRLFYQTAELLLVMRVELPPLICYF